jgi:hypothetical protein
LDKFFTVPSPKLVEQFMIGEYVLRSEEKLVCVTVGHRINLPKEDSFFSFFVNLLKLGGQRIAGIHFVFAPEQVHSRNFKAIFRLIEPNVGVGETLLRLHNFITRMRPSRLFLQSLRNRTASLSIDSMIVTGTVKT